MLRTAIAVLLLIGAFTTGCQAEKPRTYAMGFNAAAPRFNIETILKCIQTWMPHADGAVHIQDVPWKKLLGGTSAEDCVRQDLLQLIGMYRAKHFTVAITVEPLNGIDRAAESKELTGMGRSIKEPEVQKVYREYCVAVAKLAKPDYLGLGVETNMVHALAPKPVYDALVKMADEAAAEIKKVASDVKMYVSAQVETAWGLMPNKGGYVGVEDTFQDFPFIQMLGVSSYPYFAYHEPEDIPPDYFSRVLKGRNMPIVYVEGGWPTRTATFPGEASEQAQVRWVQKLGALLDRCDARLCCPILFADLDLDAMPQFKDTILPLFASLGLSDKDFKPKPALAEWDKLRSRPLRR